MVEPTVRPVRRHRPWLVPYLVVVLVAATAIGALMSRPEPPTTERVTDYVVVVGVTDLRWEDIDRERTPQLWQLAQSGAVGSLAARAPGRPTCPLDGWLALGAGNWATAPGASEEAGCAPVDVTLETPDASGAFLPDQPGWVRHNQRYLPWGAVPGTLAGSVRCTTAVGQGAAVAAARSYGGVDWYASRLPQPRAEAEEFLARCVLGVVDLGAVRGEGEQRAAAARGVDAALERVLAARPPGSVVLVAGVGDLGPQPHLQVAIAEGPGFRPGWLTSASTGRAGYLQVVDLAPTALGVLGRPVPAAGRIAGHPAYSQPSRPDDAAAAVAALAAADQEATRTRPVVGWFLAVLTAAQLLLFGAMVPLLRWPERVPRLRRLAPPVLVMAAAAVPMTLLVGVLPWWRLEPAAAVFAGLCAVGLLAVGATVFAAGPARRGLTVLGVGSAGAAAVVGLDLLSGVGLRLDGVVGYAAHDGGRYAGVGATGLGVLLAGILLPAGCLAQQVRRRWRPAVVVAVGGFGVVLVGSPYLGADPAGAMALTAGVALTAAMSTGAWLTFGRLAWAVVAGAAVTFTVAVADLWRPVEHRGGLGAFLTDFADGRAGFAVQRISYANVDALFHTPLTVLAIGAGSFVWLVLFHSGGGLRRVFGIHPAVRAGVAGSVVATLLAGVLTGSALTVAGAAAAVTVPLLTVAALWLREPIRPAVPPDPAADPAGRTPRPAVTC